MSKEAGMVVGHERTWDPPEPRVKQYPRGTQTRPGEMIARLELVNDRLEIRWLGVE